MSFPRFGLVRQLFPETPAPRPDEWLDDELKRTNLLAPIKPGQKVLITAGSRGIDSLPEVIKALVGRVKAVGGEPFIYPAMGSHGGGTAAGQVDVLKHLGVTEQTMGAPVYDKWDLVEIGRTVGDAPVIVDRAAVEADQIILVNRVKEHTDYIGPHESGLMKIGVIGLGRQGGAQAMHRLAVNITYTKAIHAAAEVLLDKLNILGGVALLENHHNQLRRLAAVPADRLLEEEPALLAESRKWKAGLPYDDLNLLLIDNIGKEISGTGADTKVVGRIFNRFEQECDKPFIGRLIIRDITPNSYGNAIGIGLADYTVRRLVDKIDYAPMDLNCITGSRPELGRVPITLANDRQALETGFGTIGMWTPDQVAAVWMSDTKHLDYLAVSEGLFRRAAERDDLEPIGDLFPLTFDNNGQLGWLTDLIPA